MLPSCTGAILMAQGDKSKQPPECKEDEGKGCPHLQEDGGGFEGERYRCKVCGKSYFLDYEDMK